MDLLGAFVTPWLATAGAAAVSVPILIHLFARRRFKRIRWAAMDFLIDAEKRNRRRIRLEELILLALRCLAMLLLGFLVARPFLTPSGLAAALSGARHVEHIFVMDDSYSMGYESEGGTPFEQSKSAMRRLLTKIHELTPDDTATLIKTSAPDSPLVAGAFLDSTQLEQILAQVDALELSQRPMDVTSVFEGVVEALERDPGILNAVVYVLSDFQRSDWVQIGSSENPAALTESLESWAEKDREIHLYFVDLGAEDRSNTAVTGLALTGGQVVAGTEGVIRATLANYSSSNTGPISVELSAGNRPATSKQIDGLEERQTAGIELETSFLRPGDEPLKLDLPRDRLPLDNSRYLTVPVVPAIKVLLVNGEPSPDAFDDEVALLATALRPEGDVFSGFEVVTVDEPGFEDMSLADVHVVVLANVYRISDPTIESLEAFARDGGGVMIFLGDQVDADTFNTTLYRNGKGLAPAELIEIRRPADPVHLVIEDRSHPAIRGIGQGDDPLGIGRIPFETFFAARRPKPQEGEENGLEKESPSSDNAEVLARFDDDEESPAIIERSFGKGRVLLVTTSADKEWNAWPNHPTYLPVMLELVGYLSRAGGDDAGVKVGEPIELGFDPTGFGTDVTLRTPLYPGEPESFLTAVPDEKRGVVARWEQTDTAGFYEFVLRRRDGTEDTGLVAVNVDPKESDLTVADETQLRRAVGDLPLEYIRGLVDLESGTGEGRAELWVFCAIGALLILMTEQTLAWRWGRGR